ncbi:(E)-4-hydroxy-3-methylbut-2-enyl-diphosphate synthase, partial [Flavobacteriales bacterium]|nr:(E)-4-hydroxy-3-methylbut-2-enyl-diphosphate synthase [Flavobacteriales bacterium]
MEQNAASHSQSDQLNVDWFNYRRRVSRQIKVGDLALGGDAPIRIQSMTTADTLDVKKTVDESIRMVDAGSELVRITAPSKKEAEALGSIAKALEVANKHVPLVADIHFTPNAAEVAADHVEKIRVNPGNYADKKKFEEIDYTDESYAAELDRIETRFTPLVLKCKRLGRAMRIGTNHGSLSDRILSRYGDTPMGMVESALEFLRICRKHDYHEIVISMKASNPQVMVQAYRLLVARMDAEGMNYPLHLGVTEAGDGEDGRIKSAIGIGALLEDGLGDTIRVSLTEAPEAELPVARKLVDRYAQRGHSPTMDAMPLSFDPFNHARRVAQEVLNIGGKNVPVVVHDLSTGDITPARLFGCGYRYSVPLDKWNLDDFACDYIYSGNREIEFELPGTLGVIQDAADWRGAKRHYPLWSAATWNPEANSDVHFIQAKKADLTEAFVSRLKGRKDIVLALETSSAHAMADLRGCCMQLDQMKCDVPVLLTRKLDDLDDESFQLFASVDLGAPLLDGFGDGIWMAGNQASLQLRNSTAFGILQATR